MTVDDFLEILPEWQGASYEPLQGGLTNNAWKVTAGDRSGVLKIDESLRGLPFNSRNVEAQVQRSAAAIELAPAVIYSNERVIFTEFVEGTVWDRDCLDEPANLERIGQALRRLHSLPLTGGTRDLAETAMMYGQRVDPDKRGIADLCVGIISEWRMPQNLCLCHNDPVVGNVIATPDLKFLDWEYACDNDPFFDLAVISEQHQLDEEQVLVFLDAYFEGRGTAWRRQLAVQQRIYRALLWLWMAARDDTDPVELEAVAERVLTTSS